MLLQIFNLKTFAVKFLSAVTAVGSGLPVGPEGPMIHLGAIVGECELRWDACDYRGQIAVWELRQLVEQSREPARNTK